MNDYTKIAVSQAIVVLADAMHDEFDVDVDDVLDALTGTLVEPEDIKELYDHIHSIADI